MNADEWLRMNAVITEAGLLSAGLGDDDFEKLWNAKYRTAEHLRHATRSGLESADLAPGVVDKIVSALGAAAGPSLAVGRTTGAAAGPGSGSTAIGGTDESIAKQLIEPKLDRPPPLEDLESFLSEPPAVKIPIASGYLVFSRLDPQWAQCFQVLVSHLPYVIGISLELPLLDDSSETVTMTNVMTVVVSLLLALDSQLPASLSLGIQADYDQRDYCSLLACTSDGSAPLRPGGFLRDKAGIRMLAKWQTRAAGRLPEAVKDLKKKTAVWTSLYYGDIEYLPCFAAAGSHLQFFAISKACGMVHEPFPVSRVLDLRVPNDRAQAVVTSINFYRLLRAQRMLYPEHVLPAGLEREVENSSQLFKRAVLFRPDRPVLLKRVAPWANYEDWSGVKFKHMLEVYRATENRQGVVHALDGVPTLQDDRYLVDLVPVGFSSEDAPLQTEDDVRQLVHCLLHGLAAIHEAGFVHRDLRWDNIAWSQPGYRWFLIDLETCAPANQEPVAGFRPFGWRSDTLVDGRYTRASDLYQLGLLVRQKGSWFVTSETGRRFMDALCTVPADQRRSASELLTLCWLRCVGCSCSIAGAQPGER